MKKWKIFKYLKMYKKFEILFIFTPFTKVEFRLKVESIVLGLMN